jgi:class 3 adenylate cyclase
MMKFSPPKTSERYSPFLVRYFAAFLALPLRLKITIPYLIVAILLAGLATWVITQSFVNSLQERFNVQLVDGFQTASTQVFQSESRALITERAIARTMGVAEAAVSSNSNRLDTIIRPLAVNAHAPLVHILDTSGKPIYGLRLTPAENVHNQVVDFTTWPLVHRVLTGESDELGDKFSGIIDGPDGVVLYLAGPLLLNNQRVGIVLVGYPLGALLPQMIADSNAQVSIYRPNGQVAFSTFHNQADIPELSSDMLPSLNATGLHPLQNRLWTLDANEYNEAIGPLLVRGQPSGWAMAVALPRVLITNSARISPVQLAIAFALAVLAVITLGAVIAKIIAIPVFELVNASTRVAKGDLEARVKEHAYDELGLLSRQFNHMVSQLHQREFMRDLFGRMVSEEVREALVQGRQAQLGGELKVVSVLFTDIRDFTAFSESHSPQEVVGMLNSYFSIINHAVRKAGGMINKFGGDSTMAIFGAPMSLPPEETARRALQAALAIRIKITEANAYRVQAGLEMLNIGIGINTGEVITGNVGAEDRFEYTVIGDTVNVAARMQSLAIKSALSNIFITEATYTAFLAGREQLLVTDYGTVAFKGKTELVHVYSVIGLQPTKILATADAITLTHRNNVPRRDAFEAAFLYCRGFDPTTIATAKGLPLETVQLWIHQTASRFERSKYELRREFELTDMELKRLYDVNQNAPAILQNLQWEGRAQ